MLFSLEAKHTQATCWIELIAECKFNFLESLVGSATVGKYYPKLMITSIPSEEENAAVPFQPATCRSEKQSRKQQCLDRIREFVKEEKRRGQASIAMVRRDA